MVESEAQIESEAAVAPIRDLKVESKELKSLPLTEMILPPVAGPDFTATVPTDGARYDTANPSVPN
jgi:hypothetical protein